MHANDVRTNQCSRVLPTGLVRDFDQAQVEDVSRLTTQRDYFSGYLNDHIRHVDEILATLVDGGVKVKINWCHFFQCKVEYFGHKVKPGTLEIEKSKV